MQEGAEKTKNFFRKKVDQEEGLKGPKINVSLFARSTMERSKADKVIQQESLRGIATMFRFALAAPCFRRNKTRCA
ncbi:MAG: hypothetical protein AAGU74_01140 [Bacillota bacterium]